MFSMELVQEWLREANKIVQAKRPAVELVADRGGRRYVKIVEKHHGFGEPQIKSVFAFIDTQTGFILKPASWKAPARGVRGTLADIPDAMQWVSYFGIKSYQR